MSIVRCTIIDYKTEEVAEIAVANNDILIPIASIDPAKGKMGVREDGCLISKKSPSKTTCGYKF